MLFWARGLRWPTYCICVNALVWRCTIEQKNFRSDSLVLALTHNYIKYLRLNICYLL